VQAASRGARRPIGPGEALHSGDRIEMYLEVDQPAYVYVVQFFPDHSSAVLFPPEGDLRLRPGAPHRIPARGQSFQLDDATGEENIYVVAAGKPLAQADLAVAKVVEQVRVSSAAAGASAGGGSGAGGGAGVSALPADPEPAGALAAPSLGGEPPAHGAPIAKADSGPARVRRTRPAPGALSMKTRGLVTVADDDGQVLHARTDAQGVAVFRFWFQHLP